MISVEYHIIHTIASVDYDCHIVLTIALLPSPLAFEQVSPLIPSSGGNASSNVSNINSYPWPLIPRKIYRKTPSTLLYGILVIQLLHFQVEISTLLMRLLPPPALQSCQPQPDFHNHHQRFSNYYDHNLIRLRRKLMRDRGISAFPAFRLRSPFPATYRRTALIGITDIEWPQWQRSQLRRIFS